MREILKAIALLCISISLSSSAFAVAQGFYLGIATGPATNGSSSQPVQLFTCPTCPNPFNCPQPCGPCAGPNCTNMPFNFTGQPGQPASPIGQPTTNQWGSRIFMGYMFNPYVGGELGFNFFSGIHYNFKTPPGFTACSGARVRIRAIDLTGKFALPISFGGGCSGIPEFDVYVRAGIAATYQTISSSLNSIQNKQTNCNIVPCNGGKVNPCPSGANPNCPGNKVNFSTQCGATNYINKYTPVIAIGASWDVTQSTVVDISYMRLLTGGIANNMSAIMVGLSYHFVDVYCGQFLCDE